MGYAVRTATQRYVEWRKCATGEVVARELYTDEGDALFEQVNLAAEPRFQATVARLAALLPVTPAPGATEKNWDVAPASSR